MEYIKPLDSLRAIAVLLVIISHWVPKTHILNHFPNGVIGVDIFFVLSGFLITSILFQNRNPQNISKGQVIKKFYARRILRIFPIYYLTIFILLAFHDLTGTNIKSDFLYYVTYTSNFNFFLTGSQDGILTPFWSLAVEEQFYLFWPWLIIFTKRKDLIFVISAFILVGIVSRFIFSGFPLSRFLTTSCFDSFGIGALLSWVVLYKKEKINSFYVISRTLSFLIIGAIIFGNIFLSENYWTIIPEGTANSIFAIWAITYIYINRDSDSPMIKYILNNKTLIFIGQISYGIYVYHQLIAKILMSLRDYLIKSNVFFEGLSNMPYSIFLLVNFFIVLLISRMSYKYIETPFLKLKKQFVMDNPSKH